MIVVRHTFQPISLMTNVAGRWTLHEWGLKETIKFVLHYNIAVAIFRVTNILFLHYINYNQKGETFTSEKYIRYTTESRSAIDVLVIANTEGKWKYLTDKVAQERNATCSESPHRNSHHIPLVRSKFNLDVFFSRNPFMCKNDSRLNTSLITTFLISSYRGWAIIYPTYIYKMHWLFSNRCRNIWERIPKSH